RGRPAILCPVNHTIMRNTIAILLRKVGGRAVVFFRSRSYLSPLFAGVGAPQTANELGAARSLLAFAFPLLLVLAVLALALAGLGTESLAALATAPAVVRKNEVANEFRAKADQIRAELMDESKTFTKDEIEKRAEEI